jgi:hypothetical protein
MATQSVCTVKIRAGRDHARRAVAFLDYPQIGYVDVHQGFVGLSASEKSISIQVLTIGLAELITSLIGIMVGIGANTAVSIKNASSLRNAPHRLYGFLCHPKEPEDKRFWMCVLILHAEKRKWTTDETELRRAEEMRRSIEVQSAIKRIDWNEEVERL